VRIVEDPPVNRKWSALGGDEVNGAKVRHIDPLLRSRWWSAGNLVLSRYLNDKLALWL
jgi:hypothetical protein